MLPEPLTCCVCGGPHHPEDCARARKFIRECQNTRISPPPPPPPPPPYRRPDHDYICAVLRNAMMVIDELDKASMLRHHQLNYERTLGR